MPLTQLRNNLYQKACLESALGKIRAEIVRRKKLPKEDGRQTQEETADQLGVSTRDVSEIVNRTSLRDALSKYLCFASTLGIRLPDVQQTAEDMVRLEVIRSAQQVRRKHGQPMHLSIDETSCELIRQATDPLHPNPDANIEPDNMRRLIGELDELFPKFPQYADAPSTFPKEEVVYLAADMLCSDEDIQMMLSIILFPFFLRREFPGHLHAQLLSADCELNLIIPCANTYEPDGPPPYDAQIHRYCWKSNWLPPPHALRLVLAARSINEGTTIFEQHNALLDFKSKNRLPSSDLLVPYQPRIARLSWLNAMQDVRIAQGEPSRRIAPNEVKDSLDAFSYQPSLPDIAKADEDFLHWYGLEGEYVLRPKFEEIGHGDTMYADHNEFKIKLTYESEASWDYERPTPWEKRWNDDDFTFVSMNDP